MPKKKEDKIQSILSSIDATLKQQTSIKRVFMQGLVRGLGTALGATVLLAIVTSIMIQLADSFDWYEFSRQFFSNAVEQ